MRGLYVHIPFCKAICSYCDFPKEIAKEARKEEYVNKLLAEMEAKHIQNQRFDTVYIGGGTPNSLSNDILERIFEYLKPILISSKENTIELNPELVTKELCVLLNKYNFNRVSLGIQTINPKHLKLLNRHHDKEIINIAINELLNMNITNINADFIFGIPYQSMIELNEDIDYALSLPLKHISYYSLIIENKTIINNLIKHNQIKEADDDLEADMYSLICSKLEMNGFRHYEISNFAKDGYESIHNQLYWNCDEYEAVGAGASSYIKPYRITNSRSIGNYINQNDIERELIDINSEKEEFFILGLRLVDGVSIKTYKDKFKSDPFKDFDINSLIDKKLLEIIDDKIRIPKDKLFIANLVYEKFLEVNNG